MAKKIRSYTRRDIERAYIAGGNEFNRLKSISAFMSDVDRQMKSRADNYASSLEMYFQPKKRYTQGEEDGE